MQPIRLWSLPSLWDSVGGMLLTSLVWRRRRSRCGLVVTLAVLPGALPQTRGGRSGRGLCLARCLAAFSGRRAVRAEADATHPWSSHYLHGNQTTSPDDRAAGADHPRSRMRAGLVQASVGGRLSPPVGGFKALGTPVKTGDVLAFVRPPLPLADATAQQQQARELDQQISIVTRKVERLRTHPASDCEKPARGCRA